MAQVNRLPPSADRIISPARKTAVILFNLGGPDNLRAVQPFLFNLFSDKAIIGLPNPMRWLLAQFISRKRTAQAQKIYAQIGGKSPITEHTQAQAAALESILGGSGIVKVFVAMRYWQPQAAEVAQAVKKFAPDHIILLPLYPQFSTTTTGSSFADWRRAAYAAGLNKTPVSHVCCYPAHPGFIAAHVQLISSYYALATPHGRPRILFSAHGLPEKIIAKGDPYQMQVEAGTQAILRNLDIAGVDYVNCYQSRVGPLQWIGPATSDEISRAGADGVPVLLVPIAFVSEHSETLVELDVDYAHLAREAGVQHYHRVPTLSLNAHYIAALADICLTLTCTHGLAPAAGAPRCGREFRRCPCRQKGTL